MMDLLQRYQTLFVLAGSASCVVACVGDFAVPMVLARSYPGYSHVRDVLSELGTARSPVAQWINRWWLVFGLLLIVFAIGVAAACHPGGAPVYILSGLLIVFGVLGGMAAGLFPMDSAGSRPTVAGKLHDILGGIGFLALMLIPVVSLWAFPRGEFPVLYRLSAVTSFAGMIPLVLLALSARARGGWLSWAGLWQRLFLLNYYTHLTALALTMIGRGV